jgi:hypothetical protein
MAGPGLPGDVIDAPTCLWDAQQTHWEGGNAMWARVIRVTGDGSRAEDALRVINEEVIPGIKELGFASRGYWLMNRSEGKVVAFTLYDTEQALRESEAAMAAIRQQNVDKVGGIVESVEEFEVVGEF